MARTTARGGPQTRARIAEVATGLFLERGFDAVTVAEVARQAGVSAVTVFNHFPRKEDLFLDRAQDAADFLAAALRDRTDRVSPVEALRELTFRLLDSRHPLSGADPRSLPFFKTVAASPALVARAREIAAGLTRGLAADLRRDPGFGGDPDLLAAFFVAGYGTVLTACAGRLLDGEPADAVLVDQRAAFTRLFTALSHGVAS